MAWEAKVRIWTHAPDATTYTVDSADASADTFTLATDEGDLTELFRAGLNFFHGTGANTGWYTVVSSAWDSSNTIITVASVGSTTATDAEIYIYDYITLDMPGTKAMPEWSMPQKSIKNRHGLTNRIMDPNSTAKQRYMNAVTIVATEVDCDLISALNKRLPEFFEDNSITDDAQYKIFIYTQGYSQGDHLATREYTDKRYCRGRLEDIPGWLYGLRTTEPGESVDINLNFNINDDGAFTNFNQQTSSSSRTRPT